MRTLTERGIKSPGELAFHCLEGWILLSTQGWGQPACGCLLRSQQSSSLPYVVRLVSTPLNKILVLNRLLPVSVKKKTVDFLSGRQTMSKHHFQTSLLGFAVPASCLHCNPNFKELTGSWMALLNARQRFPTRSKWLRPGLGCSSVVEPH